MVRRQLPKLKSAGSIPVTRSGVSRAIGGVEQLCLARTRVYATLLGLGFGASAPSEPPDVLSAEERHGGKHHKRVSPQGEEPRCQRGPRRVRSPSPALFLSPFAGAV